MKCIICNDEISCNIHLKKHINKYHNIDNLNNEINYIKSQSNISDEDLNDIKKMYISGYNSYDIKIKYNINCSNYIELLGIKRTNSESKKTLIYKNKVETTNLKNYGVKNPSQSENIKEKKKQTFLSNSGYENNFCNKETQNKAQKNIDYDKTQKSLIKTLKLKYGIDITNIAQIPGVGDKISVTKKKMFSTMSECDRRKYTEKARSYINYVSSLELRIQSILNDLSITYTANGFLYSYNFDLIFKNKLILEIQGDFWHANPIIYKSEDIILKGLYAKDLWKKDEQKKKKVESKGYKIYYLWESEINKMSDDNIITFLHKILC